MKNRSFLIAVLILMVLFHRASAQDVLDRDGITVSGLIRLSSTAAPSGTLSIPITIPSLLKTLNITGVNPKKVRYFYDENIDGYVIAPSSIASGGTGIPIITIFVFGNTAISWDGKPGKNPEFVHSGDQAVGLNGNVTGSRQDAQYKLPSGAVKLVSTALLSGTIGTNPAVVQLSISDTY